MNIKYYLERILVKWAALIPDYIYLKLKYKLRFGTWPNFKRPQSFNEKLNWLKLYNRRTEYTKMVDKYAVKEYVSSVLDEECIIPTLGIWNSPNDIDFNLLPNKFVLKTTHGGGGVGIVICRDKKTFNVQKAKSILQTSLNSCIYRTLKEWPYKNVPHKIIAEQYIEDKKYGELRDYKFFCFNGEVKFCKVDFGRFVEHHANYYDPDWNLLPFGEKQFPPQKDTIIEKPKNFELMKLYASKLSQNIPFIRVDLYNVNGHIYFGEITFYPASGFGEFEPTEWDHEIGKWLLLPSKMK